MSPRQGEARPSNVNGERALPIGVSDKHPRFFGFATQRNFDPRAMAKRMRLGVALGSGSARGWAHVGILRALVEEGLAPEFVAGCSMGAMIGASFAAGRLEQLEAWALSLDLKGVVGLLDIGLRGGLIKGDRLLDMFHGQFVQCQFSELPLPFAAVATDLVSG